MSGHPSPPLRPTHTRYVVLGWFCAAAVIAYVQRTAIGVAAPQIGTDLGLDETRLGLVMSGFYAAYALSQIPAGWLGDRWGSRRALSVYIAGASLLCGLLAAAGGFRSLLVVWLGAGVAVAGLFPCCARSINGWFPETERALPSGFLGSFQSVGAALSTALTGWLLSVGLTASGPTITWRLVFLLYAVPGVLWAIGFARWFRDRPEDHPAVSAAELDHIRQGRTAEAAHPSKAPPTPWGRMFASPKMGFLCGQQFFRAAGYVFYATWFPTYLEEVHHVSTAAAGYLTSLPLLGGVLGGLVGGPVADAVLRRTGSRRLSRQLPGAASQFACGGLIVAAWFVADPVPAVLLIALGSFLFAFGGCAAYTVTIDIAGRHVATVFGTMNMAGNLGAAACPTVVGWIIDRQLAGWNSVLLLFAGIYLVAGLFWLALDPQGTLFDDAG